MPRRVLLPLAGAAILTAFSVAALPFSQGLFRAPRTPYDAGEAGFIAPAWIVLTRADPLIPRGAPVVVRIEPRDDWTDTHLHRLAVSLLPGRRIIPAARWGTPNEPEQIAEARYEIVVGPVAEERRPAGSPILDLPEGSVWLR